MVNKQEQKIADDILSSAETDNFLYKMSNNRPALVRKLKIVKKVLEGTDAIATLELARNYNMRGVEWGIFIHFLDEKAFDKLVNKYDLGTEYDVLPRSL